MSTKPNAITSANVPQAATVIIDKDDPYPGVQARPLQMPDFINIKPKNPLISLRFVNRVAGSGQRLDQMTFAGFILAKPEDCYINRPDGSRQDIPSSMIKDGQIQVGDLVCMKIDKKIYEGALKYNHMRAVDRLHPRAALRTGQEQIKQVLRESGAGKVPELKSKIQAYQPSAAETAKLEADQDGK
jgi:hypothetical protein